MGMEDLWVILLKAVLRSKLNQRKQHRKMTNYTENITK